MADVSHIQDQNDAGSGNDAASTALVADWLGAVPKHNLAPDAATSAKPADIATPKPGDATAKPADIATPKPGDATAKPADIATPKPGDATVKPTDAAVAGSSSSDANLDSERGKLKAQAEQSIKDPQERAKFEANMAKFEQRATSGNPPVPADEVAKTYKAVDRLLTAQDNPDSPLHADDRRKIAEQIMSQAADPTTINPSPDTCGATAVEKVMYTRYPAEAAKVVVDVATTGKFTTPGGETVPIDKESIVAHNDGSAAFGIGKRSQASQIFQVTADNALIRKFNPDGNLKFEQREPTKDNNTGEKLVKTGVFSNKTLSSGFGTGEVYSDEIVEMANLLSGKNDISVIRNKDMPDFQDDGDEGKKLAQKAFGENLSQEFESEAQLKDMLTQAQRNGKMPVIMEVNAADGLADVTEETSAGHVLTVLNYDEKTGKALIDTNDYGTKEVSIDTLYQASMKYETYLEQGIKKDHEAGVVDTTKELELLKVHNFNSASSLSDKDFNKQYEQILDRANQAWAQEKQDGTFNQAEHDRVVKMALGLAKERYGDMDSADDYIGAQMKMEILKAQHKDGIISDTDYTQSVYDDINYAAYNIRTNNAKYGHDTSQNWKGFRSSLNPTEQQYLDKLLQEPPYDK